jgi:pyridoxine 4-dehydrogenase
MSLKLINYSSLGLGTSHTASLGRRISTAEAKNLFHLALELNVTTIDTSDTYGSGDSERMIGRAISAKRKDFQIITKAGFPYLDLPGFMSPMNQIGKKILQKSNIKKCYSKDYLIKSLEKSLKRLGTDYVDAFLLHEPLGSELLYNDDFFEGLELIKKKGMAHHIGISTNDLQAYQIAVDNIELDVVQTAMPYGIDEKDTVFYHAKTNNIPVVVNQILNPYRSFLQNNEVCAVLDKYGKTNEELISILLAYTIEYKKGQCALIGTRNPTHLIQNVEGFHQNRDSEAIFQKISKQLL